MPHNIRIVSTYPPRRCGIGTFSRDLATALAHFTAEVGHIRVAAIDHDNGPYDIPVDLTIDQYNPESWRNAITHIATRAGEGANPTAIALQHEFGLDPDEHDNDGQGHHFVETATAFQELGLTTLVYLHTVLDEPDSHQKKTVQDLARHSDGLIVTTESAIQILESDTYGIPHTKLKHIDHGIRMQHPSQFDRLSVAAKADVLRLGCSRLAVQFQIQIGLGALRDVRSLGGILRQEGGYVPPNGRARQAYDHQAHQNAQKGPRCVTFLASHCLHPPGSRYALDIEIGHFEGGG